MIRAALLPDRLVPPLDGVIPAWPGERVTVDGTAMFVRHTPPTSADAEPLLAETQPELDPFLVYTHGEDELARQLATLNRDQLLAIALVYDLESSLVDLDTLTVPELIAWIVGAVRERLAA